MTIPLAYMAAIYLLSSLPGTTTEDTPGAYVVLLWAPAAVQNLLHVPLFGGLAWLWHRTLTSRMNSGVAAGFAAFVITVVFGLFDEWHQMSVPGRYASLTDVVLNTLGAVIALWLTMRKRKVPPVGRNHGDRSIT